MAWCRSQLMVLLSVFFFFPLDFESSVLTWVRQQLSDIDLHTPNLAKAEFKEGTCQGSRREGKECTQSLESGQPVEGYGGEERREESSYKKLITKQGYVRRDLQSLPLLVQSVLTR